MTNPPSTPPLASIGQVAERFGLRKGALRFYEKLGLLAPPRTGGGRRGYRPEDLRQLAFVQLCQDGGLRRCRWSVRSAPGGCRRPRC